jgi:hypothetical protein
MGDRPPTDPLGEEHTPHSNDRRPLGFYQSRYPQGAWAQIIVELLILLAYLTVALVGVFTAIRLGNMAACARACPDIAHTTFEAAVGATLPWSAMFFCALAGGTTFATKWLYHSVAKAEWNRDRILWRFIAPVNSAVLATAAGFGISAGIMPFLDQNSFGNIYTALFFGFFIGHFSDHVLAALQRLAKKWFGTVDNT